MSLPLSGARFGWPGTSVRRTGWPTSSASLLPRTWYADHPEQLEAIESDGPFVIKPASKGDFFRVTKAKAWRADGRGELVKRFKEGARLVPPGQLMVQELIPGDGRQQFAYCAFFKNGEAVGSMTVRRRRQHPPDFGRASTFVETIDLPVLATLSERFLREIDYYGLIELEYKLDCRDGRYKLLDVNPRTWGYHSLGQDAGVDFPHLLFADQLEPSGRLLPRASWPTMDQTRDRPPDRPCRDSKW